MPHTLTKQRIAGFAMALLGLVNLAASVMNSQWTLFWLSQQAQSVWSLVSVILLTGGLGIWAHAYHRSWRHLMRQAPDPTTESGRHAMMLDQALKTGKTLALIVDSLGRIDYASPYVCKLTGFDENELLGQPLDRLSPSPRQCALENISGVWLGDMLHDGWQGEIACRGREGQMIWTAVNVTRVTWRGDETRYVIHAIDITELKHTSEHIKAMALYDELTGLANRRLFADRLEQALRACHRDQTRLAIMFLDLDQFKRINDTLGHDAGDALLQTVAERLKACVREKDTVARLGGDEFVILLTDVHEAGVVSRVADNVIARIKEPVMVGTTELMVSTSVGITLAPDDGAEVDTLMKNADLALYKAKSMGRDGYQFFTDELNRKAIRRMTIEHELRAALRSEEFSLTFQPQFDLKTGRIVRAEALLRWHHPERGLMNPGDFLDVAEDTGLISQLGAWVLKQATTQTRLLQNLTGKPLQVAVNLSHKQFHDPALVDNVMQALQASDLPAQFLVLEITESMLLKDLAHCSRVLRQLKRFGVSISIDDFGSGYSSLSYLRKLPIDILKVDRAFIRDIPEQLADMEVTAAIIALAHKLGLKVAAEGVENVDQHDFLVIHKCDYAQGYYYSHPLTFEEMFRYTSDAPVAPRA